MHICKMLSLLQHQAWNQILTYTITQQKSSFINHIVNMLTSKENKYKNTTVTSVMLIVFFVFDTQNSPARGR